MNTRGTFTIIAGPMTGNSFTYGDKTGLGKTSTLIEVAKAVTAQFGPDSVLALQPIENTRDNGELKGKNGESWPAMLLDDPLKARAAIEKPGVKVLVVDEAHLWLKREKALLALIMKALSLGISVWIVGCDTDHMNKPFPWFKLMKPAADKVHMVTGRCQCGRPATKTFRHGLSEEAICVDTNEGHYESSCEFCAVCCHYARMLRKEGAKGNENPTAEELVEFWSRAKETFFRQG